MVAATLNYTKITDPTMREAVELYIERGIKPGSFLQAVISNDLVGAMAHAHRALTADDIRDIVQWFYWEAPHTCFGSREKLEHWHELRASTAA